MEQGELEAWHTLALKLGEPSIPRLQRKLTTKQWLRWKIFLQEEFHRIRPEHYYWAAITAEVARGHSKNPRSIKIEDRLLKFRKSESRPGPSMKKSDSKTDVKDARLASVKTAWFAAVGLSSSGESTGVVKTAKPSRKLRP